MSLVLRWRWLQKGCHPQGAAWSFPRITVGLQTAEISCPGENGNIGSGTLYIIPAKLLALHKLCPLQVLPQKF